MQMPCKSYNLQGIWYQIASNFSDHARSTSLTLGFPLCPRLKTQTQHGRRPCGFVFRPHLTKASFRRRVRKTKSRNMRCGACALSDHARICWRTSSPKPLLQIENLAKPNGFAGSFFVRPLQSQALDGTSKKITPLKERGFLLDVTTPGFKPGTFWAEINTVYFIYKINGLHRQNKGMLTNGCLGKNK